MCYTFCVKSIKARQLTGLWESSVGLMGKKRHEPLFFRTRWGIHTFFVLFPIDVVILDNTNSVVEIFEGLKPNRIVLWNPKYSRILELPKGSINSLKLKKGEIIRLNLF